MLCFIMAFGCAAFAEEPIRIAYSTNGLSNPQMAETADHMVTYAQEKYGATLVLQMPIPMQTRRLCKLRTLFNPAWMH